MVAGKRLFNATRLAACSFAPKVKQYAGGIVVQATAAIDRRFILLDTSLPSSTHLSLSCRQRASRKFIDDVQTSRLRGADDVGFLFLSTEATVVREPTFELRLLPMRFLATSRSSTSKEEER
jgi:hypothetical protein